MFKVKTSYWVFLTWLILFILKKWQRLAIRLSLRLPNICSLSTLFICLCMYVCLCVLAAHVCEGQWTPSLPSPRHCLPHFLETGLSAHCSGTPVWASWVLGLQVCAIPPVKHTRRHTHTHAHTHCDSPCWRAYGLFPAILYSTALGGYVEGSLYTCDVL